MGEMCPSFCQEMQWRYGPLRINIFPQQNEQNHLAHVHKQVDLYFQSSGSFG